VILFQVGLITDVRAGSKPSLTKGQERILKLAYIEGSRIGYPETVQAIVWQETHAGNYKWNKYGIVGDSNGHSLGEKSYGVGQVRLSTAKFVLKRYSYLGTFPDDEHLLVALLTDDHFNLSIVAHYFKMQVEAFENPGAWGKSVLAYNVGPGNVKRRGTGFDPNRYIDKVWIHIRTIVRPFNKGKYLIK
jgi:hypothetical protein